MMMENVSMGRIQNDGQIHLFSFLSTIPQNNLVWGAYKAYEPRICAIKHISILI